MAGVFDKKVYQGYHECAASEAFFSIKIYSYTHMKLVEYIRETKGELKHVSWPTRRQAIAFTVLVVALSLIVSVYLGVFDAIFSEIVKMIVA